MIAALKESKIELNVNEARQSSSPALPSWHLHRALQPSADRAMLRCEDLSKGCDVSVGGGGWGPVHSWLRGRSWKRGQTWRSGSVDVRKSRQNVRPSHPQKKNSIHAHDGVLPI